MTDQERESLWASYFENPDQETRNKIIIEYLPLLTLHTTKVVEFLLPATT